MDQPTHTGKKSQLPTLALLAALVAAPLLATDLPEELRRAQQLLERGQAAQALPLLDAHLRRHPRDAGALLLRSTTHFLLDDVATGGRDLDRALELDPRLRQGWLNRAGMQLAEGRPDQALESLERARALDPSALDNSLNVGAVLLLLGRLDEASRNFQDYLVRQPASAEASYLVAVNYAASGYAGLTLQHLRRAIELDERSRLQARSDERFAGLFEHPRFQDLLAADLYRPPPGARLAQRSFNAPFGSGEGPLLQAVLDALMVLQEPFDPRVEVTPSWALVWGEMRIKVAEAPGGGVVELSAPHDRFTEAQWQERSKRLLDSTYVHLQKRQR